MSSFRAELKPLVGHTITVATVCGSVTGRLTLVGTDKIVVRTSEAKFLIRIRKICWVRRKSSSGFSPCHCGHHHHQPHLKERCVLW